MSRNISILDLPAGPIRDQAAKQIAEQIAAKASQSQQAPEPAKASKYHNKRTEYASTQGFTRLYDSKAEARYAQSLDADMKLGLVLFWLPQVPIPLPGGVTYRVDFMVAQTLGSALQFVDVKSAHTAKLPTYRMKKKQVEAIYGIKIVEVFP